MVSGTVPLDLRGDCTWLARQTTSRRVLEEGLPGYGFKHSTKGNLKAASDEEAE
ncbi:hypothetical protein OHA02_35370 [Streptomyces phaeochromogenes]|nr:hypothetical protein [Streptomyces phaeochromogenes]